jgi:thiol-disulfide isomerase/thioredoxin
MIQGLFTTRRGLALIGIAVVAGIAASALAVYVNNRASGNGTQLAAQVCSEALQTVARIEKHAGGDLAAFRVADNPDLLTDLVFKAPDSSKTGISAFGGRTVLLNLWATWCGPCRAEMPALDRLQAELGGDRFEVVAVNIDIGAPERAKAFLDEVEVKHLAFYADSSAAIFNDLKRRGLALGLPTTILIDGNGCRLGGIQGPAEWDSPDALALIRAALEV